MKLKDNAEYNLEVCLTPHPWDNPEEPYFWWVSETSPAVKDYTMNDGTEVKKGDIQTCNTGCCGWGATPEKAWQKGWETWNKWLAYD